VIALLTDAASRRAAPRLTGWRHGNLPHGFTLLEILVVIVVVGVIISVTTISVGVLGRDREMQDQAERIWAVLNQTKEECELQGFDVGLRVGTNSYDFLRFDPRQQLWLPIVDDDLLTTRTLPPGLRLRLWLEGREVVLKEQLESEPSDAPAEKTTSTDIKEWEKSYKDDDSLVKDKPEKKKELPPQIMILSSGDVNSFDLQFEREGGDARWHVFAHPDSSLTAEQVVEST
jgi:general secretion pathway protein H